MREGVSEGQLFDTILLDQETCAFGDPNQLFDAVDEIDRLSNDSGLKTPVNFVLMTLSDRKHQMVAKLLVQQMDRVVVSLLTKPIKREALVSRINSFPLMIADNSSSRFVLFVWKIFIGANA